MTISLLAQTFNQWAQDRFNDVGSELLIATGALTAGWLIGRYKRSVSKKNAKAAILKGRLEGTRAILSETIYRPTGKINPVTKQEFFEQHIRNPQEIDLLDLFPSEVSDELLGYIDAASEYCTKDYPCVFHHLTKVVPKTEWPHVKNMISTQWITYFSGQFTNLSNFVSVPQNQKISTLNNENRILPILVWEDGVRKEQYRVLLFDQDALENIARIDRANVMTHEGKYNQQDPRMARVDTNKAVLETLRNPLHSWISDLVVRVPSFHPTERSNPSL